MFKNLRLGVKIGSGFGVVMLLMSLVIGMTIFALLYADSGIKTYRGLATSTNLAGRLQANMLLVRMNVKDFLITSSDKDVEEFNEYVQRMDGFLRQAEESIQIPEQISKIEKIRELITQYKEAFPRVVEATRKKDQIRDEELYAYGQSMGDLISSIVGSAYWDKDTDAAFFASEVLQTLLNGRLQVYRFLQMGNVKDYERASQILNAQLTEKLNALDLQIQNPQRRAQLDQIKQIQQEYLAALNQARDLIIYRADIVDNTLDAIGPEVAMLAEDVKLSIMAEQDLIGPKLKASTENSILYSVIIAIIALSAGVIAALKITQNIVKPLRHAVDSANQLAQGDLRVNVTSNSRDETGQLLTAIQNMAAKLREMISTISAASLELSSASEELAVITEQTTKGIAKQQTETEMVATSMHQMTTTVVSVANDASQAADAAKQASQEAIEGGKVVENTISSINALSENVRRSAQELSKVQQDVVNISSILSVIRSIAEQTNLLALNAAIEAARAGEQGRGFSVVADEVRSLASRTQGSTAQIQTIIEQLQTGTQSTVDVMSQSEEEAGRCVVQSEKANTALLAINDRIAVISDMNMQIASAAEEQSTVAESINQSIMSVKEVAEENTEASKQTRSSTNEIATLAVSLNSLVTQFRL